jgi:hypothetical protein
MPAKEIVPVDGAPASDPELPQEPSPQVHVGEELPPLSEQRSAWPKWRTFPPMSRPLY